MLFNSLGFLLLFLPLVLIGARLLRGKPLLAWICVASAVFYAFAGHAWFLVPMAITTLLDFWVGHRLEVTKGRARVFLLVMSLSCNLGLLAYFKYSGLIAESVYAIAHLFGVPLSSSAGSAIRVLLPAGISFYTFQTMSYVIDIYRGHSRAERSFFAYLAFVAFFPHLVAGPLTRHNQLIPQLHAIEKNGISPRWWAGVSLFSIGLVKKVLIADRVGNLVDIVLGDVGELRMTTAWLAAIGYAMQIYFDFSAYSDMAVGLGRLFGIELPQNFDSPYKSLNPSDFWRRWHITLSQWLRDYLYISLGGNRCSAARVKFNLMATMVLGGLWHGANWTFAAWGGFHGLLLVVYQSRRKAWDALPSAVQRVVMFLLVCVGWVFFRAPNLHDAGRWLHAMTGADGLVGHSAYATRLAVLCVLAFVVATRAPNAYEIDLERITTPRRAALGLLTAAAIVMMNYSSKFLYFQF